jgi:hypothetical protein
MKAAMSPKLWDRFDRLIQEIEEDGPHSASRIKQIAVECAMEEEECVRRMVLAYYSIAVDPIRSHEGQRIGNYKLGRLIGEGAMGAVYLGKECTRPYRKVAVKLIHPRYSNKNLRNLFLQQIDRYRHLDHHPQIVPLLSSEIFLDPKTKVEIPYYVMPYIQGNMNLKRFITVKRPTAIERLRIFKNVCAGVRHLHKNGIIHGDLKPNNILVDEEGNPFIIDFGLGVDLLLDRDESNRIADAYRVADTRTDIRALGGILGGLFGKGFTEIPTSPSFLRRFWHLAQSQQDSSKHLQLDRSMHFRRKKLNGILRKTVRTSVSENSEGYQTIDELVLDVDGLINEADTGSNTSHSSAKRWLLLLGIGLSIESFGHLTGSLYAKAGGWMLIHMAVALFVIGLFLCLTIQYIHHLSSVLNRTLTVAYGTGLIASFIGGLIYAFSPPAQTDIIEQLDPVRHVKFMRFITVGLVLPIFYSVLLATGTAKREDPFFKAAEWRVVIWLSLWLVIGVLIFTSIHLTEHPVLSMFFGNRMQGDVRCEIFILVAYICTLSLIFYENWQSMSTIKDSRSHIDASAFLSRTSVAIVSTTVSGVILAKAFWGQGLTPNLHDGTYALLATGLISVWSIASFILFTGNHAIIRSVDGYLAPHLKNKNLWIRMINLLWDHFHKNKSIIMK